MFQETHRRKSERHAGVKHLDDEWQSQRGIGFFPHSFAAWECRQDDARVHHVMLQQQGMQLESSEEQIYGVHQQIGLECPVLCMFTG